MDVAVQLGNRRNGDASAAGGFQFPWRGMRAIQVNTLMRAIPTGYVAQLAADALLFVNARHDFEIQIQMVPVGDLGSAQPAKIIDAFEAFFAHPVLKAVDHVLHDAIAVMHRGRANLDSPAAEQNKFGRITPCADTADA